MVELTNTEIVNSTNSLVGYEFANLLQKNVVFARIYIDRTIEYCNYEGKRQSERKREMREEKEAVAGGGKPVAWRPRSLSGLCALCR